MILIFNNFKRKYKDPKFISYANCLYDNDKQVLDNIWKNKTFLRKSLKYLNRTNEKIIYELSIKFRKTLGLDYNLKFWKIILWPWLSYFSFVVFDSYHILKKSSKIKNLKQILLCKNKISEYCPYDYQQFAHLLKNDEYRFYIFSNIAEKLNLNKLKKKYINIKLNKNKNIYLNGDYRKLNFLERIKIFLLKLVFNFKKKYIILDLKFGNAFKKLKYLIFYFKFAFFAFKDKKYGEQIDYDKELRSKFTINLQNNEFEKILSEIIAYQIPTSILEHLNQNIQFVKKNYPKKVEKITSANSFWGDDIVKIWIATIVENNGIFYPRQHGGSYGTDRVHANELIEKKLGEEFLSWGWKDKNVKPMPSIEKNILFEKNNRFNKNINNESKNIKKILLILSPSNRYSKNIYSTPMGDEWYFHNQNILKFLKNMLKNLLKLM